MVFSYGPKIHTWTGLQMSCFFFFFFSGIGFPTSVTFYLKSVRCYKVFSASTFIVAIHVALYPKSRPINHLILHRSRPFKKINTLFVSLRTKL